MVLAFCGSRKRKGSLGEPPPRGIAHRSTFWRPSHGRGGGLEGSTPRPWLPVLRRTRRQPATSRDVVRDTLTPAVGGAYAFAYSRAPGARPRARFLYSLECAATRRVQADRRFPAYNPAGRG